MGLSGCQCQMILSFTFVLQFFFFVADNYLAATQSVLLLKLLYLPRKDLEKVIHLLIMSRLDYCNPSLRLGVRGQKSSRKRYFDVICNHNCLF